MTPPPGPTYDEGFGHEPMSALEDLAALCLATGALLIAAAGVKVAVDSRAHFLTGESLAALGDRRHTPADEVAAAEAYARAVKSYVPFFSHGPEALARIRTVGETLSKDVNAPELLKRSPTTETSASEVNSTTPRSPFDFVNLSFSTNAV